VARALSLLVLLAAAVAAGCSSSGSPGPPPSVAAPPQRAELGWEERFPPTGPALVFRAHRLAVTAAGWEVDVEIDNGTPIPWELGADRVAVGRSFGVMLFATADVEEVERRQRDDDLPGLRPARRFVPVLPVELRPGRTWRGTVSAEGRLAAGRYLRLVFGPLVARGEPPQGMPSQFSWITDHAYLLRP
jgi:hypothetical protein